MDLADSSYRQSGDGHSPVLAADIYCDLDTVSVGIGVCFDVELQPGLAKIRMRAKTWKPATT